MSRSTFWATVNIHSHCSSNIWRLNNYFRGLHFQNNTRFSILGSVGITEYYKNCWNLLVELFGEFNNLRGQRHAGFHNHEVSSTRGVSLPLGTLGGPLPLLVLDRHVGTVLHQSLRNGKRDSNNDCSLIYLL